MMQFKYSALPRAWSQDHYTTRVALSQPVREHWACLSLTTKQRHVLNDDYLLHLASCFIMHLPSFAWQSPDLHTLPPEGA
eukprot:1796137-Amphidinium_carterae.3